MSMELWDQGNRGSSRFRTSTPLTKPSGIQISDIKGVPSHRRKTVEGAVLAGASRLSDAHEAWIVPTRKPPGFAVRIIGPRGFYREIRFAGLETELEIEHRVRHAIEDLP